MRTRLGVHRCTVDRTAVFVTDPITPCIPPCKGGHGLTACREGTQRTADFGMTALRASMAARNRRFVESGNSVFDIADGDSERTQRCHISPRGFVRGG